MGKGTSTRERIITRALEIASTEGVQGLSLGRLAERVGMSKSGLFAHFHSKEELQLQVLEAAVEAFRAMVVEPVRAVPSGPDRFRTLFDRWLAWNQARAEMPGGCIFTQVSTELDDQPGPPRDFLVGALREWQDTLAAFTRGAVRSGTFRADLDVSLFVFQLRAVMLGEIHARQLLGDPEAGRHTRAAFDALIASAASPQP